MTCRLCNLYVAKIRETYRMSICLDCEVAEIRRIYKEGKEPWTQITEKEMEEHWAIRQASAGVREAMQEPLIPYEEWCEIQDG